MTNGRRCPDLPEFSAKADKILATRLSCMMECSRLFVYLVLMLSFVCFERRPFRLHHRQIQI